MSDIVIRGMEMPKSCLYCNISHICKAYKKANKISGVIRYGIDKRLKNCPIKGEIPDKHGNLKDTDVVIEKLTDKIYDPNISLVEPSELIEQMIEIIKNAPTILEASK